MESADFLSFVVTRFPSTRPHGISRTSFLVYSRNLRTWATSIFLDFSALSHLIHPIRLIIAFLFVEPRFRYPFLSPLPHDSQAWESLLGSPVAGAHGGLTPQIYDMPVVLQNIAPSGAIFLFFLFRWCVDGNLHFKACSLWFIIFNSNGSF